MSGSAVFNCGTQFSHTRRATSGLTYTVEFSTNLSAWNPADVTIVSVGDPDAKGVQTVTLTVNNAAVDGKLFVRVRAE
ncbi:MAG: hypothetical protein NTW21_42575 [Verrucomicrobia bacterium]|nr:hypothetical protein [Verrucomicrobiota bacterium]